MNARQMKQGLIHMMYLAKGMNYNNYNTGFDVPYSHALGSTPLNEALLASMDIIPAFQRKNNVQIVNCLVLTDGDASGMLGSYGMITMLRDPETKQVAEMNSRYDCTPAILDLARSVLVRSSSVSTLTSPSLSVVTMMRTRLRSTRRTVSPAPTRLDTPSTSSSRRRRISRTTTLRISTRTHPTRNSRTHS